MGSSGIEGGGGGGYSPWAGGRDMPVGFGSDGPPPQQGGPAPPSGGGLFGGGMGRSLMSGPPPTQPGGYRSPAAGLGGADLMLNGPVRGRDVQINPRAQLDPSMLAPKVQGRTTPDKVLDPAWYAAEEKRKSPTVDYSQYINYKDGGAVDMSDVLGRYGYAHGGVADPSDAQKKAGNYRKGHIKFHGLDVSIETGKGQKRRGQDPSGKKWTVEMPADYGYVKGTLGADGDHVDVFVGPHAESTTVFIINQCHHNTGKFDEHKAMLGYKSEKDAVADYCKAFSDGKGPDRIKSVETVSVDAFKKWLQSGKTKSPARGSAIVDHAIKHVIGRKG